MTAVDVDALDKLREAAAAVLYPGLYADEAYRRHPAQIDRAAPVISDALKLRALRDAIEGLAEWWADPFGQWTADQADAARQQKSEMVRRLRAVVAAVDGGEQ